MLQVLTSCPGTGGIAGSGPTGMFTISRVHASVIILTQGQGVENANPNEAPEPLVDEGGSHALVRSWYSTFPFVPFL